MSPGRKLTLPPWLRPNAARAVKQPSWIAKSKPESVPASPRLSLVPPPPRDPSVAPPSSRPRSIAPAKLSLVPLPDPRIAELERSLAELAADFTALEKAVLEAAQPELVRLALTIAERVVGREITADPTLIESWAHEAIETLGSKHAVVIAVSPDLANTIEGAIVDASLPNGSCEVRDGARTIAVGARSRMQAMTDALEQTE